MSALSSSSLARLRQQIGVNITVPGHGPSPCRVMAVGEAPGREEAFARPPRPFVGHSGAELRWYLRNRHLNLDSWYLTNLVKLYIKGNPDPTPALISEWGPKLDAEVRRVRPDVIIAIGRFAARYFIGADLTMEMVHGIPHSPGALDPSIAYRACGAIIMPMFHPALGLHRAEARPSIDWDAEQIAFLFNSLDISRYTGKRYYYSIPPRPIRVESRERLSQYDYRDVSGVGVDELLTTLYEGRDRRYRRNRENDLYHNRIVLGCDTEGSRHNRWSIQLSALQGTGVICRCVQKDFDRAIQSLGDLLRTGEATLLLHNAPHDINVIKGMGLDLTDPAIKIVDTMAMAWLLVTEPQKLKVLAYRWLGRKRDDFESLTAASAVPLQLEYLRRVVAANFKPPGKLIRFKDWRFQTYSPWSASRRATNILEAWHKSTGTPLSSDDSDAEFIDYEGVDADETDRETPDVDADAEPISLAGKWSTLPAEVAAPVHSLLGPFPRPSIDLVPLCDAIGYAVADADDTLGVYDAMFPVLRERNLLSTLEESMSVLPLFSDMQDGLPNSRSYLRDLSGWLEREMLAKHDILCDQYNGGKHINPDSPPQVRAFLSRHGIQPTKKTKTGQVSTAKKSIEPFRFAPKDAPEPIKARAAMVDILLTCREIKHLKDSFSDPLLRRADAIAMEILEQGDLSTPPDVVWIGCNVKHTRTATRRLAMSNPNWLNIPKRTEMGRKLRGAVQAPEGFILITCDLKQVEARIFASKSRDPKLIAMFLANGDIHTETAAMIFGVPLDQVSEDQRRAAKTINFGILYGMTPGALFTQLAMLGLLYTLNECKTIHKTYMSTYLGVPRYIDEVRRETLETLSSSDDSGMTRPLPGIRHYDRGVVEESIRFAVSQRVQGAAQTAIQRSMAYLRRSLFALRHSGVKLLLQIHDELDILAPVSLADSVAYLAVDALENHHGLKLRIPLKSDMKMAKSWDKLK